MRLPVENRSSSSAVTLAEGLLRDLARWDFGELLARRSGWAGVEPLRLTMEVRAYRLAILRQVLPEPDFWNPNVVLPLAFESMDPALSWELCRAWEGVEEGALAAQLLRRLAALAPLDLAEAPLKRFAQGKAGKYASRVRFLIRQFEVQRDAP
jgi:hypothetical protein